MAIVTVSFSFETSEDHVATIFFCSPSKESRSHNIGEIVDIDDCTYKIINKKYEYSRRLTELEKEVENELSLNVDYLLRRE
ncbi:hypothetical protein C9J27_05385 [Photobacterium kishitanii]|uniref:Uncharacterized protein n=1 Tax=Photobacterium kishitanii TaxID=318456 RepID=A0A2T3KLM4_9GAMM|nr:hypothetical protein C9J27_05385 [Photobacterium kishitanii]